MNFILDQTVRIRYPFENDGNRDTIRLFVLLKFLEGVRLSGSESANLKAIWRLWNKPAIIDVRISV